ncbi:MAG: [FeFe] hydrogenase H-cluster maturation GTPase HydF [bacterium]
MQTTPKSLRLTIAILGRTNVGKSSLLNYIAGQDVSITAPLPGTTTDVVEKPMELLPLGPVLFLDTAGLDDTTALGGQRVARTARAFNRADVALLVLEPNRFGPEEEQLLARARERKLPVIAVVGKCDLEAPAAAWMTRVQEHAPQVLLASTMNAAERSAFREAFIQALIACCPDDFLRPPSLVGDLVQPGGLAVLVVPIDMEAPRGRLILPQVQTIRDALDHDAAALVVKERELAPMLRRLTQPPDIVICDSQAVLQVVADTPLSVPCTTFSILFARLKGDLPRLAEGAAAVDCLQGGDAVLVAEACSHHALEDDIGRVKIPRWLRQYTGAALQIETVAGRDFPADLSTYKLVVQCGGCMVTRREVLARIQQAQAASVPITNYGLCIAQTQGVLPRVLAPFPAALEAYALRRKKIQDLEEAVARDR